MWKTYSEGTDAFYNLIYLSYLTPHTAVVGTVRPLFSSSRNGQFALYLFKKHVRCWEHVCIVSCSKLASIKVTFCVSF